MLTFHAVGMLGHETASNLNTHAVDSVRLRGRQVSPSRFGPTCFASEANSHTARVITREVTSTQVMHIQVTLGELH